MLYPDALFRGRERGEVCLPHKLRRCYGASEIDAEQNVPLPEDVKKLVAVESELDMLATLTQDYPRRSGTGIIHP